MATSVTWNNTSYSIPAAGELNWASLSDFLIALGGGSGQPGAQVSGKAQKVGMRSVTGAGAVTVSDIDDCVVVINKTVGAATTVNLPAGVAGRVFMIVDGKGDAQTNNITIDPNGAETIMGSSTYVINVNNAAVIIGWTGSDWKIIAAYEGAKIPNDRLAILTTASLVSNSATTATSSNTNNAIVARDGSGNFSAGTITANLSGNATTATSATTATTATNFSGSLSGDVTGTQSATAISATTVTGKALTGFVSGAGTVSATDTILTAFNKINGNVAGKEPTITTLPVSKGGTNSGTALNNNRVMVSSGGAIVEGSAITANKALISDANGIPTASSVTNTELGYVSGVSSAIQTQLNGKEPTITTLAASKGGLGTDASAFSGVVKASSGTFSASTLVNTDVDVAAAIDFSKLATLPSANLIVGSSTGVPTARAITGDITISNTGVTAIGSGVIVNNDVSASAAIAGSKISPSFGTSVTVSGGNYDVQGTSGDGYVEFATQNVNPSSAPSNAVRVFAKQDNKLYKIDSAGSVSEIGSGGGSAGVNYLSKWYDGSEAVGTVSTVAANGNVSVTAGSFVSGRTYIIASIGTTNFTLIGATSNTVGLIFVATGSGSGTGTAISQQWFANTASGAAAIASSSSDLLRGSTNLLTALTNSATPADGSTFVQTPVFEIDGEDVGKALSVAFDLTGNTTSDDWDVVAVRYNNLGTFQELIPIAGTASSITGTSSARLPIGTSTFNGFFITSGTSTDFYSVRWRRRIGTVNIRLDSLTVGPNQVLQGAIMTDWQDISSPAVPTGLGTGSGSWDYYRYRRVGGSLELDGVFRKDASAGTGAAVVVFPIPVSGITFDSNNAQNFAQTFLIGGNAGFRTMSIEIANATQFRINKDGASGNCTGADFAANSQVRIKANFKIVEWQSNTQQAARAVEEYASHNGTTTVYGPSGAALPNITASAVNTRTAYTVTWQTSLLPTDKVVLEGSVDQVNWVDIGSGATEANWNWGKFTLQSTGADARYYGVGFRNGTGNTSTVEFGNAGARVAVAGAYGGVGTNWSSGLGYWRLRKVSGGAAVGFPVGARNVIGDTTGTAVPAGYIGETITTSLSTDTVVNGSTTNTQNLNLTPGVWDISAEVYVRSGTSPSFGSFIDGTSAPANGGDFSFPSSNGGTAIRRNVLVTSTRNVPVYIVNNSANAVTVRAYYAARRLA